MKLKNILEKFFNGLTVMETVDSRFNGIIKVDEDLFGHRRLSVGGITQSGKDVEKVWKEAISKLPNLQIANCLILGLGAGNAAKTINKYFPKAKITGIEIDQEIIMLGKKYFGLSEISNLDIIISDAISFIINHSPSTMSYDLILVDLYLGDCFPEQAEESKFLESLGKVLKPDGTIIFNRLYYLNHKEKTDKFEKRLQKVFTKIEAKISNYNKLFLCRK